MACLAWCAVVVWVVSLVGWMIQGEVEPLFGFAGIGMAFVLGFWTMQPPQPYMRFVALASVVGMLFVFPSLRATIRKMQLGAIDIEVMQNAYQQLRERPDNQMARFKLARMLYERGQVAAGIAVGRAALKNMPERLFPDEYRLLARWKSNHKSVNPDQVITCLDCGYGNSGEEIYCQRCRREYLIDVARGRWVGKDYARKLLACWIGGILAVAGIPFAATLPPAFAIPLIILIAGGAITLLIVAFRGSGKPRA